MATVDRKPGFPMFAVALGGLGALCLLLGVLGQFRPELLTFATVLRTGFVPGALMVTGAILIAVELALVLAWSKRRSASGRLQ